MNKLKKLMILDEDKERGDYRYRIACHCTDNNCDLDFCIESDSRENPKGSGKYEVDDWSLEFYTCREHYGSYWQRFKTALRMIFGGNKYVLHSFMLDKENIAAIRYVLDKYDEVGDLISKNL